jgi:hypothetical protein
MLVLRVAAWVGFGLLAGASMGAEAQAQTTVIVCAPEAAADAGQSPVAFPVAIAFRKGKDGVFAALGEWKDAKIIGVDAPRITLVGVNFLITVYHKRGALVGVDDVVPLVCADISGTVANAAASGQ